MKLNNIVYVLMIFIIVGCRQLPTYKEAVGLSITNITRSQISKVNLVNCGQAETKINAISKKVGPGESVFIKLQKKCVDIKVYSSEGLLLGTQNSVSIPPTLYWKVY